MLEEEMREIDECDLEEFETLDMSEKTIAIIGDTCWPQAGKQEGDKVSKTKSNCVIYGKNVMSAQLSEMSLLGVGTVVRLERDAWSMVKRLWQATYQYPPPTPVPVYTHQSLVATD